MAGWRARPALLGLALGEFAHERMDGLRVRRRVGRSRIHRGARAWRGHVRPGGRGGPGHDRTPGGHQVPEPRSGPRPGLYLAPERWAGAPSSPATEVYAATAVFFECLTGEAPFAGNPAQVREQHDFAAVPLDRVDPPLRRFIATGMAKDPASRPRSAIAFASQLEALAANAYGPGWEERGRRQLAERAAALLSSLRDGRKGPAAPVHPPRPRPRSATRARSRRQHRGRSSSGGFTPRGSRGRCRR